MRQKIINFFNSPKLKTIKEIDVNQLLFFLSDKTIATNSGDAYYFIRVCAGMGVLKKIKPKLYRIDRKVLQEEAEALKKENENGENYG